MLLMALPNEHQLTFNQYKDAKTLFAAIQTRFGGNDATKKTQKTLLKQMYENFNAPSIESLDSIFNRLQKIRNKPDLDSMSFDDLYNNFKIVKQEVKRTVTSSSNSGSQNMAFVTTPSSTNEVNTANVQVSTANFTVSTDSTLDKDLEQIHEDDLEEMDLKLQLALLSMRARKYYQRTGKKITINGSDTTGYDKSKIECFNCHKMGHFARECRGPRNQEIRARNQDSSRRTMNVEEIASKAMLAIDGAGFDWSYMADKEVPTNLALMAFSDSEVHNNKTCSNTCLKAFETLKTQLDNLRVEFNKSEFSLATYKRGLASVEEQLVFYKKNKVMLCDKIVVLKRDASFKDLEINALNIQIEKIKKEKESNQIKIDNFENASKSYRFKANKGVCEDSSNEIKKTNDAPIIEDWVSDCDDDDYEVMVLKSDNVQQKPKQASQPRKMVQKPVLSNVKKGTGQREVRPVWNNALRVNHQNFSNSRRNFVPTAVLIKSRIIPVSAARPINIAAPKFFMNVNSVNTAKGNKVTRAVGEQGINVVKSSACWVWRPKIKVLDHISKNSGSHSCKQFDYVDPIGLELKGYLINNGYVDLEKILDDWNKKELAILGQTVTGKEFSNPLMADTLPKTILPTKFVE
ncbi:ribonuclease H-like domain-containing protein [Tanacetum coccineum]